MTNYQIGDVVGLYHPHTGPRGSQRGVVTATWRSATGWYNADGTGPAPDMVRIISATDGKVYGRSVGLRSVWPMNAGDDADLLRLQILVLRGALRTEYRRAAWHDKYVHQGAS